MPARALLVVGALIAVLVFAVVATRGGEAHDAYADEFRRADARLTTLVTTAAEGQGTLLDKAAEARADARGYERIATELERADPPEPLRVEHEEFVEALRAAADELRLIARQLETGEARPGSPIPSEAARRLVGARERLADAVVRGS